MNTKWYNDKVISMIAMTDVIIKLSMTVKIIIAATTVVVLGLLKKKKKIALLFLLPLVQFVS